MSEKDKALENAMAQIDRQFGKGSIMRMSDYGNKMAVESIPTGSIALDVALGGGGVPRGRVVEIYGPESSGKTTLCYHIMAEAQKLGGVAAYIDAEHAFDPEYAARCGLNLENLLISQPDNGEQALEIAETLVRSNAIDVIVVNSVAALVPRAEIEGEMGDSHVGLMARLMSQALRKLVGAVSKSHCCLIFTNQIRMKIGVMYGNPETTTGGQALKFYASVRMEIRRVESIKSGTDISGNRVKREGSQEQGSAALQDCRVRHHVQRRHQPHRLAGRHGRGAWRAQEERRVLLLSATRASARAAKT